MYETGLAFSIYIYIFFLSRYFLENLSSFSLTANIIAAMAMKMPSSGFSDELMDDDDEVIDGVISPRCEHGSKELNYQLKYTGSQIASDNQSSISCIPETPDNINEESPIIKTRYRVPRQNIVQPICNDIFSSNYTGMTGYSEIQTQDSSIIPGSDSDILQILNNDDNSDNLTNKRKVCTSPVTNRLKNNDVHNFDSTSESELSRAMHIGNNYESNFPSILSGSSNHSKGRQIKRQYQDQRNNQSNINNRPSQDLSNIVNNEQVILIEPVIDEQNTNVKKFFSNETSLARNINNSILSRYGIIDTQKNLAKNILVVKIPKIDYQDLKELLITDKIGEWKVKCRLPVQEQSSRGVIGPIGVDTPDEDLFEVLREKTESIKEVRRITKVKGKEKISTVYVMIVFEGKELPEYVFMYQQRYKVKLYVNNPWQCFNCQNFGHNASDCRGRTKCLVCSGPHRLSECPGKETGEVKEPKCANCGEKHAANYGGCKSMKLAKTVEQVRSSQRMSYRDALNAIKKQNPSIVRHNQSSRNTNQVYDDHLKSEYYQNRRQSYNTITVKDFGTQTDNQYNVDKANEKMLIQMTVLMIKVLKMNDEINITKNPKVCFEHLIKMIGINISDTQLEQINEELGELNETDNSNSENNNLIKNGTSHIEGAKPKKQRGNNYNKSNNENKTVSYDSDDDLINDNNISQSSSQIQPWQTHNSHHKQYEKYKKKDGKTQKGKKNSQWK